MSGRTKRPMPHKRGKNRAQDMLSVFETGQVLSNYGACAVLEDGAGISYGKHQSTDGGDTLDTIVEEYIADPRAMYGSQLAHYLDALRRDETAAVDPNNLPGWVQALMHLLTKAGNEDPVMQRIQDDVFDRDYWQPAAEQCETMGLTLPLAWALIYDTSIHSGGPDGKTERAVWNIRKRFAEAPPSGGGDERAWCVAYARARYRWLAVYPNERVAATKYRMTEFLRLMLDEGNWYLFAPFAVAGITVELPKHREQPSNTG